jgi:hypothetical protein
VQLAAVRELVSQVHPEALRRAFLDGRLEVARASHLTEDHPALLGFGLLARQLVLRPSCPLAVRATHQLVWQLAGLASFELAFSGTALHALLLPRGWFRPLTTDLEDKKILSLHFQRFVIFVQLNLVPLLRLNEADGRAQAAIERWLAFLKTCLYFG